MAFDPRLKEAAREMKAVCEKYDIGAHLALVSKTHGEFQIHFPTWTATQYETEADGRQKVRLKCKKEELEKAELSAHFLCSMRDMLALGFENFSKMLSQVCEYWEIEHKPFHRMEPHREPPPGESV